MSSATRDLQVGEERGFGAARLTLVAVAAAAALVAASMWLVGPAPKAADEGFPKSPPPLALPTGTSPDSVIAGAAARLAAGDVDGARSRFVDVVAADPENVAGQVGLVLSRWRATGPVSVERDLRQLTLEYPDSALAALHLGLVQSLLDDPRVARVTLRDAVRIGRESADPTSLRMATLADDVLHPDGFRGSMPVLVRPAEVGERDRPALRRLVAAVGRDDRALAARIGAQLQQSADELAQVAGVAASFTKDDAEETAERLDAIAPKLGPAARDRAQLHATLSLLWTGAERDAGCVRLASLASRGADPATRRLATPIHRELCA